MLGLGALAISGAAVAGPYAGGSFALSERGGYSDVENARGKKLSVGYRFDDFPLMLELNRFDAGDAGIDDSGGAELSYSGWSGLVGWWSRAAGSDSGFWLAGGFYNGDTEVTDPSGRVGPAGARYKQSASGAMLSAGGAWMFTENVGLQLSLDSLVGVEDFSEDENITVVSLGLVFELPTRKREASPSSAPIYIPPYLRNSGLATAGAIEQQPPASASGVPRPPDSVPMGVAGATRVVAEPARLLRQPRFDAEADSRVPVGASVVLRQRQSDAAGDAWWLVEYGGASGWLSETLLH
ncbi:hypothetical protein D0B54_00790 [Solimonas sp. K1W22B-7]|nr:hypothetical protein D0B54_00790 [Solimonas sp. K1W22B-7]